MSRAQLTSTDQQNSGGPVSPFLAGKNKIINGDFGIWQRGTSFTNVGYGADRFTTAWSVAPTSATISRQTFTPGTAPVAGYEGQYFWRYAITTVGSNTDFYLNQLIENVQTLAGQTATLSFWAKADSARTISANWQQQFGSGGSSNVLGSGTNFTLSTSWVRYTWTFQVPSLAGKTVGTNSIFQIFWSFIPASGATFDMWGVQLEAGSVATPFTTASNTLQGELALCQRYYYTPIYGNPTSTGSTFGPISQNAQNINGFAGLQFPVSMRTAPTLTLYSNGTANYVRQTSNGAQNYLGASPTIYVLNNNGYVAIISASASLTTGVMYDWTYTVSAEL